MHWLLVLPVGLLLTMGAASFAGFVVLAVDRGEPVQLDRRVLSLMIRESVARAVLFALRPLGVADSGPVLAPGPVPGAEGRRVPVLLVPGASNNRAALGFLRTFLVRRGFRWVWAVNPSHGKEGLAVGAEHLAAQIVRLRQESGATEIDVVGHGSGGLLAAWVVRHLDAGRSVRRLVTLGTPWKGTRMSVFRRGLLGEQTRYGAHLLDDLAPPPVRAISIWSPDDPTVVPTSSALADGLESVEVESAGHAEMLLSARVFRAVQAALS